MAESETNLHDEGKLLRSWTLWYLIPDRYTMRDSNWFDFLHTVAPFETIDQFWEVFNAVEAVSQLPKGCRYYVFRTGVQPLWEDKANHGGCEIALEKPIQKARREVDSKWMGLLTSVVGSTFPHTDMINGLEITVRAENYRIEIWAAHATPEIEAEIANEFSRIVGWGNQPRISRINVGEN